MPNNDEVGYILDLQGNVGISAMPDRVRAGFPFRALEALQRFIGFDEETLQGLLLMSRRTARRRAKEKEALTAAESDRLYRVAKLVTYAVHVFEDKEKARTWLNRPNSALDGKTPLSMLDTDVGIDQVRTVLGRIDYAIYG